MKDDRGPGPDGIGENALRNTTCRGASRFGRDRRGSIALMAALSLFILVAAAAMALDLGRLYIAKQGVQRIADQSAMAAAFAYSQGGNSTSHAQSAATGLATANGGSGATITTAIVSSPTGDGNKAAMVVVASPVSLSPFGQTTQGIASITVGATAYAEIQDVTPCAIAIGGGVAMIGGTRITTTGCAVVSAGSVSVSDGAKITAQAVDAVGSITATNGGVITTVPTAGELFPGSSAPLDPYAKANVFARIDTVKAMSAPSPLSIGPAPTGGTGQTCSGVTSLGPGSYGTITVSSYPACTALYFTGGVGTETSIAGLQLSNATVAINFGAGTFKINGISCFGFGAFTLNFTKYATVDIWSGINLGGGTSLTINGPSTFNVKGGIGANASGALTVTNFWSATPSVFNVEGGIALMTGKTATFPDGAYTIISGDSAGFGIDVGGSVNATFGSGSFIIGQGINIAGGGSLTFGSAAGSNPVFQIPTPASDGYAIGTGGSSTLTIGAFTNDDLNGPVNVEGALYLGSGMYTINGLFSANSSGGCCISGANVSIIAAGAISLGQGYNNISLSAPATITTSTLGTAASVVLASNSTDGSLVNAGANDSRIAGAIYLPKSALTFTGAGNVNGDGGCTVMDIFSASFSGGSSFSSDCTGVVSITAAGATLVR